jgi:RNA polymerase sigma-70 factor (ECF subfamily)
MLWSMHVAGGLALENELQATGSSLEDCRVMDESAFRDLYARTARPIWVYLARSCGNDALADDLLQDTYFRMIRSGFEPESDDHARNFLFKVASNLLRDHFRSSKRSPLPLEINPAIEGGQQRSVLSSDVQKLLRELKPRERELLWLGHVERFSHKEIGRIMDLKPTSIRLLLFRARKKLAGKLQEAGLGPEVMP